MKKITVVYHYFAKYREPVFEQLVDDFEGEITFISGDEVDIPNLKLIDFPHKKIKRVKVENFWIYGILWQRDLLVKVLKSKPDSVVFLGQYNFLSTWVVSLLLRISKVKVLFWGHGFYGNESILKSTVRKIFNIIPNKHLVYGEHAKRLLVDKCFIKQKNIEVIYNSLDFQKHNYYYKSLSDHKLSCPAFATLPDNYAVFIGRLTKVKQLDLVIRALAELNSRSNSEKCTLVIIGEGPEYNYLLSLVKDLSVQDFVIFYGACHDEYKISSILYGASVCISPGNVGLTAIHSLSYGTPVISHDNPTEQMPEYEAIVPGRTGLLFKQNDIASLIESIAYFSNMQSSERSMIRASCRDVILKKYNPIVQSKLILRNV